MEDSKVTVDIDTRPTWEKMQDKVEDLMGTVARYFEGKNDENGDKPPILTSPKQRIAEEYEISVLTPELTRVRRNYCFSPT